MQSWCDSWAQKRSIGKRRHGSPNGWKNGPKKSEQFFLFAQASSTFHTISPYFTIIWVSWSKRSSSSTGGQPVLPWRWSLFAASNSEAFPGRSRLSRGKWNMFLPLSQQSFHHHLSDIAPSIFLYSQLQGWVIHVCMSWWFCSGKFCLMSFPTNSLLNNFVFADNLIRVPQPQDAGTVWIWFQVFTISC